MEDESDRATLPKDVVSLIGRLKAENPENFTKLFHFFSKELVSEPTAFLKLMGLKLARVWYATSQEWWEGKILAVQSLYLLFGLAGLVLAINKAEIRKNP